MAQVANFPYFEVEFDQDGRPVDTQQAAGLITFLKTSTTSDLLVLSHGWNNDKAQARTLYRNLLGSVRQELPAVPGVAGRDFAVLAVLWPSKKFADAELIPGGAAAIGAGVTEAALKRQLRNLVGTFGSADAKRRLADAKRLVDRLEFDLDAQREFVDLLRPLLPALDAETVTELPDELFALPGDEVIARLGTPPALVAPDPNMGGAGVIRDDDDEAGDAGGAAAFGGVFGGVLEGTRNFLNLFTYYTMKERAGTVGAGGVHDLLLQLRAARADIKLHLVGHSFGGRLVTAAAAGRAGAPPITVHSMTLLQAAFSHFGFARNWDGHGGNGFFRDVVVAARVSGPIVVTHTANDRSVGLAYPLASRLFVAVAAALGDAQDIYGGIGRNGAQKTPEAKSGTLLGSGGHYALTGCAIFNLKADTVIRDHSDVTSRQVAYALLCAVAAS